MDAVQPRRHRARPVRDSNGLTADPEHLVSSWPELEASIQERVRSGRYASASEVVREALRLLEDRDELRRVRLAEPRMRVEVGLDDLDNGSFRDGDATIDELLAGSPPPGRG